MAATLELTALLAGARPSIESLLSRCTEPLLDVNGRLVKLNLVHVSSTGVEGSLRANSVLLLHVDVVVVLESVRMLLACTHTPGAADDLQRSVGGLTAQHFIGDEASFLAEESQTSPCPRTLTLTLTLTLILSLSLSLSLTRRASLLRSPNPDPDH